MPYKYIIQEGQLKMGYVDFHSDLRDENEKRPIGGGYYFVNLKLKSIYFYGSSVDFGKVKIEDLKSIKKSGKYPEKLKDLKWYYSSEFSAINALRGEDKTLKEI